jgi:hypothetical protein
MLLVSEALLHPAPEDDKFFVLDLGPEYMKFKLVELLRMMLPIPVMSYWADYLWEKGIKPTSYYSQVGKIKLCSKSKGGIQVWQLDKYGWADMITEALKKGEIRLEA